MLLRPIDLHTHIEPDIAPGEIALLDALVFAATRSLAEADAAAGRNDEWAIWGVGCHPGLVGAQKAFSASEFERLASATAYVSEVGLDGQSRVPKDLQLATFRQVLQSLNSRPRITSIHSYQATSEVVATLTEIATSGAVLHWWLGEPDETSRAVDAGCYFSLNHSSVKRADILARIPLDRILTETDHPFGDRGARGRRPGAVASVEAQLASHYNVTADEIRQQMWSNLLSLIRATGTSTLLPRAVRLLLATI